MGGELGHNVFIALFDNLKARDFIVDNFERVSPVLKFYQKFWILFRIFHSFDYLFLLLKDIDKFFLELFVSPTKLVS